MRLIMLAIVLMTLPLANPASGDSVDMIYVTDLRQVASIAKRDNLILVLEFSSEYCGYCRRLEAQFLVPMQRNRDYDDKVLIRSVSLDNFETLVDFNGLSVATGEFASRYDVSLTPTLVFLNADGVEMSEKLVGIWSEDFYGGFIDNRIDEARGKLALVATTVSVSE
ncbi:MAG: thioredoxin fold domain-containing protein [Gammaproteobacteria bacterium]|nr:thioredoxin fold domain-containing protein [Gammaproteobacteria bacterium]MDH3449493.1 thioredoxin fold domain-containing protein [Gammaproteobacteria bacterium]